MLVLGIDPGTATTGYGVVREGEQGPEAVAYGIIQTPAGVPMPERLLTIYREEPLRQLLLSTNPIPARWRSCFFSGTSARP